MESTVSCPPDSNSSEYYDLFKHTYKVIAPINISLGILIFLWNGMVISYFYKNCQKLTPALFLLIGISDVMTALGHVIFSTAALVYIAKGQSKTTDSIMTCSFVVYRFLALMGNSSSVFLNAVLAVMRTIKIVAPFKRTNMLALRTVGLVWLCFIVALTLCDCSITAVKGWGVIQMMRFAKRKDPMFAAINYPGQTISWVVKLSDLSRVALEIALLCFFYILPVVAVLVSMLVQVLKTTRVYWSGVPDEDTPLTTDWSYVNTTVVLLAAAFLLCNSATSVFAIYESGPYFQLHFEVKQRVLAVFSSTLPLFNSLLSPLIIVTRSSNLKVHFARRLRFLCCCGLTKEQRRVRCQRPVPAEFRRRKLCVNR